MREIKFRAFDLTSKEYHYPVLWGSSMPSNWSNFYVLEQYTGLKDKNGKEVYEGDVLDVQYNYIGKVVVKWNGNGRWNISGYVMKKVEIIGNLHENPELIT